MRISDSTMEKLLLRSGAATAEQIANLKEEVSKLKRPLKELAIQNDLIDNRGIAKAFSDYAQIPFIELEPRDIQMDILQKLPERVARQYNAVVFKMDPDGTYYLAMDDPDDVQAVNFIQKDLGSNTKIFIASIDNLQSVLEMYRSNVNE